MLRKCSRFIFLQFFVEILTQENPIVDTANGRVFGKLEKTVGQSMPYFAFKGIPYAKPPVGNLRFEPPQPVENWQGLLDATYHKNPCSQINIWNILHLLGSEDCLYLNIYTPDVNGNKSVMVFIHSSAYFFLSGDSNIFGPDYLVEKDVVVVTLNYRLGPFGFLSTQDEVMPGNMGLKDMVEALRWINRNVAAFGGNPNSVTVFGESAGASSVQYFLQIPQTKNLFHKAIAESGSSLSPWAINNHPKELAFEHGRMLGIYTNDSKVLKEKLKEKDSLSLLTISFGLLAKYLLNQVNGLLYSPCIEPNVPGAVIINSPYVSLQHGRFHKVPFMIGYTSREGLLFSSAMNAFRYSPLEIDQQPELLVLEDMNIRDSNKIKEVADILYKLYFKTPAAVDADQFGDYVTDSQFIRPTHRSILLQSRHQSNIYLYKFSYEGSLNLLKEALNIKVGGVSHSDDLGYKWNMPLFRLKADKESNRIRNDIVTMWTNFAKTGNPTPNDVPVKWPRVTEGGRNGFVYLEIGKNYTIGTNLDNGIVKYWNYLYKVYSRPPYKTY